MLDDLKKYPNWVCYRLEPKPNSEKMNKIPIDPNTGYGAKSNDPTTWSSYNTALEYKEAHEDIKGLGFEFSNSPFFGVDIDGIGKEVIGFCLHPYEQESIITEFDSALKTYMEESPSGNGVHFICKGKLPPGNRRKDNVEMYDEKRFFTVTFSQINQRTNEYGEIKDCTETIKPLFEKYIGGEKKEKNALRTRSFSQTNSQINFQNIINTACISDTKLKRLYIDGDVNMYPSPSEADLALCSKLAFYTQKNAAAIDTLFRQSVLMRKKWDEKHSADGTTYGEHTIAKAIEGCRDTYKPKLDREKMHSFDDMGNAERLLDAHGADMRYNYDRKQWMTWDGTRWKLDNNMTAERYANDVIDTYMKQESTLYQKLDDDDLKKAFEKHVKKTRSHLSKVYMLKEAECKSVVHTDDFDKDPYVFNAANGVINLRTGELIGQRRENMLSKISPVECADRAECPLWLNFLNTVFCGDKELIHFIQKAVGYTLTGDTSEQCFFTLKADGSNGKSTFQTPIRYICGEYATETPIETITLDTRHNNAISIVNLEGARLVTTSEPLEDVRLNESLIKQLTGGDPVIGRGLYQNEHKYTPQLKLWVATNHDIIIRGKDYGIWRRMRVIPFNHTFSKSEVDPHFVTKLMKEAPAILRWAVDGCMMWFNERLGTPAAVERATEEYRINMNSVERFIKECCEKDGAVKASYLYNAYSRWCNECGEYKLSATKFGMEISKSFDKVHGKEGSLYIGISLL